MTEEQIIASISSEMQARARELQKQTMSATEYWGKLAEIAVSKYKASKESST